jgi:hypothetical protein
MMPEPLNEPAQPKDAPAQPAAEAAPSSATPEAEAQAEATAPPGPPAVDSATFSRCARCKHADGVNTAAGTLACKKHNMLINAEADEIPDDCAEHEPIDE